MSPVDLLGRKPVNLDTPELQRFLAGKVVLVTGAGGSIGSEICRQAMRFGPGRVVMLDRAENALFEIEQELRHRWLGADLVPYVADICDAARIDAICIKERPQVIFHCAAHKHVPMMEANAGEAVKNNIFGTRIVADAAARHECGAFVMVSTDKAVNPTSVMGATKRLAELYVQSLNGNDAASQRRSDEGKKSAAPLPVMPALRHAVASRTRFVAVRFGNVLGSSGSVVPIFQKQIEAGGPVTITHPEMRRYFMTISEASQLVMQAGAIGNGGEIFVLDMGEQVHIVELACELIRRNGFRPGEDVAIVYSGIRPGEKLYEELAGASEHTVPTSHEKIRAWQLPRADRSELEPMLAMLWESIDAPREHVIASLARCVPEYRPDIDPAQLPRLKLIEKPTLRLTAPAA